jgi:general stress protein 26
MDSINKNQPEENHKDVSGREAIERIRETVKTSATCFFCTAVSLGGSAGARPMNVRQVDDAGNLWFLSASDSHKNAEIAQQPQVRIFIQGTEHSDFLHLTGTAEVTRDKAKIKELWTPILKTWFTQGLDDARITAIQVTPHGGYYWDNKHGNTVAGIKMLIGAALGKTLDDSIEGQVRV